MTRFDLTELAVKTLEDNPVASVFTCHTEKS